MPEPRKVSLVAAFNDEGKLLLGLRNDNQRWTLPGGHANRGESADKCAVRELYEEAGLKPKNLTRLDKRTVKNGTLEITTYRAEVSGMPTGKNDPDNECTTWAWVDVSDGIPKNIAEALHGPKGKGDNVVMSLFGFKKSERVWGEELRKDDDRPDDDVDRALQQGGLYDRAVRITRDDVTPQHIERAWKRWKELPLDTLFGHTGLANLLPAVAKNPMTPHHIQQEIFDKTSPNFPMMSWLAENPNASPNVLHSMVAHALANPGKYRYAEDLLERIAKNPHTPPQDLPPLLSMPVQTDHLTAAVLGNPALPPEIIERFMHEGYPDRMRTWVARNPALSSEQIDRLIRFGSEPTAMAALGWSTNADKIAPKPALNAAHVTTALQAPGASAHVAAIHSSAVTPEHVHQFLDKYPTDAHLMGRALKSPAYTIEHGKRIVDNLSQAPKGDVYGIQARMLAEHAEKDPALLHYIATKPDVSDDVAEAVGRYAVSDQLSPEQWRMVLNASNRNLAVAAVETRAAPPAILEEAAKIPDLEFPVAENLDAPAEALRHIANTTKDSATLRVVANHRHAPTDLLDHLSRSQDEIIRIRVARNESTPPETLERLAEDPVNEVRQQLAENEKAPPHLLRRAYEAVEEEASAYPPGQVPSGWLNSRLTKIAKNPNTDAALLHEIAQRYPYRVGKEVVHHPNVGTHTIKMLAESNDLDRKTREEAREILRLHAPDALHHQRVDVKLGTNRLRKIRDHILSQGVREMHPKKLPAGDWSVGRNPKGNIDADKLQQAIDEMPSMRYNVSHSTWDGGQQHNNMPSKVFQLDLTDDHVKRLKDAGVWDTFRKFHDATMQSGHPVTHSTLGWVRYTDNSDDDPDETPNMTHEQRIQKWRDKLGRELERHHDDLDSAYDDLPTDYTEEACPDCQGHGVVREECPNCSGTGTKEDAEGNERDCQECYGDGKLNTDCPSCDGSGSYLDQDNLPMLREHIDEAKRGYEAVASGEADTGHTQYIQWARQHVPNFAAELDKMPRPEEKPVEPHEFTPSSDVAPQISKCAGCGAYGRDGHEDIMKVHAHRAAQAAKAAAAKPGRHVFIDEVQSDFGQAFSKQISADARRQADQEADAQGMDDEQREAHRQQWMERAKKEGSEFSDDKHATISNILFNGKKANEVIGESFLQHLRDKGQHDAKVQIHSVKSKAPISLGRPNEPVPGHFKHTYEEMPKKFGFEPSTYGELETQDNEDMQGAPTFGGTVRKAE